MTKKPTMIHFFYQEERKAMTFTDLVIILFILALLAYAVYDQFI
jgi:Tfp pilus assembly protein PilE